MPSHPAVALGEEAGAHPLVIAKVSKRLLWFLFICFVFSFLDRINIGFAGLTMMVDLGLSSTQFGMATTIFYLAYIACPASLSCATTKALAPELSKQGIDKGYGSGTDQVVAVMSAC